MTEGNRSYTETEIMLGALDRVIREEMKKRPSKRDNKLIDECIAEMAKLKNVRAGYTEEEIGAIVELLQEKAANKPKQEPVRQKSLRRMAAGVCAAGLIVGCGVATVAWNPFHIMWDWIIEASTETVETGVGVTYTNYGEVKKYNNIQELLVNEKITIYYPTSLPENICITRVELLAIDDVELVKFHFNNSDIDFTIQRRTSLYLNNSEYETIKTDYTTFYLSNQNDKYIARCNIDSDLYLLECVNYEDIMLLIDNLTKGY